MTKSVSSAILLAFRFYFLKFFFFVLDIYRWSKQAGYSRLAFTHDKKFSVVSYVFYTFWLVNLSHIDIALPKLKVYYSGQVCYVL